MKKHTQCFRKKKKSLLLGFRCALNYMIIAPGARSYKTPVVYSINSQCICPSSQDVRACRHIRPLYRLKYMFITIQCNNIVYYMAEINDVTRLVVKNFPLNLTPHQMETANVLLSRNKSPSKR